MRQDEFVEHVDGRHADPGSDQNIGNDDPFYLEGAITHELHRRTGSKGCWSADGIGGNQNERNYSQQKKKKGREWRIRQNIFAT
jgi:hypothetical protein